MSEVVNIPQLRFPEFNGEWEEKALGVVATITTGSTPSTSNNEYYDGDVAFVSPADIQGNRIVRSTKTTITELGLSVVREIKKRSTLFVCIGSTIGKVSQAGVNCATNQQINALTAKNSFDNDFIYSLLEFKAPRIKLLAGVQAVPQINKSEFSRFKFTFPLLPEQQKIAAFLTAVDNKIEQLSKKQELLGEYKKGLMQQIFSQVIRFKADDGSDFPDWEEKKLGDVVSTPVSDGPHLTPKFVKQGVPFLSVNNLVESKIDFSNVRYISIDDHLVFSKKCKPKKGDVLLGKAASVGKVAFVETDVEFNIWSPIAMIRPGNSNFSKYIYYCFQTRFILNQISKFTNSSSQGNIGMGDINKIIIKLPNKLEQTKIANLLSSIDSKIEQVGKQLRESKQFKKALLQQMFV